MKRKDYIIMRKTWEYIDNAYDLKTAVKKYKEAVKEYGAENVKLQEVK